MSCNIIFTIGNFNALKFQLKKCISAQLVKDKMGPGTIFQMSWLFD